MKTLFYLSVLCLCLPFKLAAVEVVNTWPRIQVVKGEVATMNAQYGGGDTANVTFEAVDVNGDLVGQVVHDESSQMLIWRFDTSGTNPGEYLVDLLTLESGVVSDRKRFILAVDNALPSSPQSIAFARPPSQRLGVPMILSGSASSGLPVSFAVVRGAAVLTNNTLDFTGRGSVTVRATQEGNEVFVAAEPVEWTFEVQGVSQVVTFNLATAARATDLVPLVASSTANLPVTLEVESGPGRIVQGQLSFTGAGSVVVKAVQEGDSQFEAAAAVRRTILVSLQTQRLTFLPPQELLLSETYALSAVSTSGLPVTLTVFSGPGVIENGVLSFTGHGSVAVRATQAGNELYESAPVVQRSIMAVNTKPQLAPIVLDDGIVGLMMNQRISGTLNPTRFTATGLPPGILLNATTGVLSGRPTAARMVGGVVQPYQVTFTALNSAGSSEPMVVDWLIQPFPAGGIGVFNGLVERSSELSFDATQKLSGLGGRLTVTSTLTGSFSGSLQLETRVHGFSGRFDTSVGGSPSALVMLNRGTGLPALRLAFAIHKETGELTGTLSDGLIETPVEVRAWRNGWHGTTNPAVAYVGTYSSALEVPEALQGDADYPQGNGFGRMSVTAAGLANWVGRMADGTPVTMSSTLGPDGQLGMFLRLYTTVNTTAGSVHGWSKITVDESGNELDGVLAWKKQGQAVSSRNYPQGFPSHELAVVGGIYTAPTRGNIVLGLSDQVNNALVRFAEGGLAAASLTQSRGGVLSQGLRINLTHRVTIPTTLAANPGRVTMSVIPSTGAVGGRISLRDSDPTDLIPPIAVVTRSASYAGMVVPRLNRAVGYFILAQLPRSLPQPTTMRNSPELSGQMILEAAP